ncbi:hypothetical protein HYW36_00830 [Candidatus Saccharibacteria bacterium]|nr:hypothetical protein [Candidatus Saccharibacteria bacterium]
MTNGFDKKQGDQPVLNASPGILKEPGGSSVNNPPAADELEPVSSESGGVIVGKPEKIEGTEGFYNPAAWRYVDKYGVPKICLLGRDVKMPDQASATDDKPVEFTADGDPIVGGGPDVGPIVLKVIGPDGRIIPELTKIVFEPKVGGPSFEDFRALSLDDGTLIFGLTWVEPDGTPFPAMLVTTTEELMEPGTSVEPKIVKDLGSGDQTTPLDEEGVKIPGKNLTPIDRHSSDTDTYSFMFRSQGKENRHRLQVFYVKEGVVTHRYDIKLPTDKEWGEWQMGTGAPPEWTDKTRREAITLIHGITIVNGEYVYTFASARMYRDQDDVLSLDNIGKPLLTSALFDDVVQRHRGRNAFYIDGWVPHRDEDGNLVLLEVFGSPGDSRTDRVFLDPREIIRQWKRPELAVAA